MTNTNTKYIAFDEFGGEPIGCAGTAAGAMEDAQRAVRLDFDLYHVDPDDLATMECTPALAAALDENHYTPWIVTVDADGRHLADVFVTGLRTVTGGVIA